MQKARFIKKQEDFVCGHCGNEVKGDGYTNHCPKCLWSKHVDINPGDRAAQCGGMMVPFSIEGKTNKHFVVNRCETCGHVKRNRCESNDDIEAIVGVITKRIAQRNRQ